MKIYFVRHGESIANTIWVFSNRGYKHGLTEKGINQVNSCGESLQLQRFDALISSPLKRAVETAEILSKYLDIPYSIDKSLNEIDVGILEDKSDEASKSLFFEMIDDWVINKNYSRSIEGGESLLDAKERFIPFIENLASIYPQSANIAIVSHATTYCCTLPFLFENVDLKFGAGNVLKNAEYIVGESIDGKYVCKSWGVIKL
ncbi:histidine phosphatase family protein [bacterium]|nr:histidine phosphatase family protein [bacterium]